MVSLDAARRGVEAHEPGVTAEPDAAPRIRHHAVQGVAREPVGARKDLKLDRLRCRGGIDDAREPTAVGGGPHAPVLVDGERVHRVGGQRRRVGGIVAEHSQHGAVGAREVEPAAVGAEPEIAARVLDDRRHVGSADRALNIGSVRQLTHPVRSGVEHVGAAAESADPQRAAARLGDRHDAGGAQRTLIAGLNGNRLDAAIRCEYFETAPHRADPQRAAAVPA